MRSHRTVINAKGQVTIPAEMRARFGIEKGTRTDWKEERGRLVLTPMTKRFIHRSRYLEGSRKQMGRSSQPRPILESIHL